MHFLIKSKFFFRREINETQRERERVNIGMMKKDETVDDACLLAIFNVHRYLSSINFYPPFLFLSPLQHNAVVFASKLLTNYTHQLISNSTIKMLNVTSNKCFKFFINFSKFYFWYFKAYLYTPSKYARFGFESS